MTNLIIIIIIIISAILNGYNISIFSTFRYAITLWYFDKDEREAEFQRLKERKEQKVCHFPV